MTAVLIAFRDVDSVQRLVAEKDEARRTWEVVPAFTGWFLLARAGVRADATARGDEQHRARSSSVFRFARRGRRVEPRGLPVGLLHRPSCEESRKPESPLSRHSAASRRPQWWPCGHRRRTAPAPLECGAEPRRRCDPACGSRVHRARWPPTSPTRLARRPRDKTSRLLQPSLSEARLQVALDTAQQTGPDVFTRMNRYGRHTLAAFDA